MQTPWYSPLFLEILGPLELELVLLSERESPLVVASSDCTTLTRPALTSFLTQLVNRTGRLYISLYLPSSGGIPVPTSSCKSSSKWSFGSHVAIRGGIVVIRPHATWTASATQCFSCSSGIFDPEAIPSRWRRHQISYVWVSIISKKQYHGYM